MIGNCFIIQLLWNRNLIMAYVVTCVKGVIQSLTCAQHENIFHCLWKCLYIIRIVQCSTPVSQGINFYIFYISGYFLHYALPYPDGHSYVLKEPLNVFEALSMSVHPFILNCNIVLIVHIVYVFVCVGWPCFDLWW